jgi:hypothetical protein
MLDKTLNQKFGLVTRADKGVELTHDELDKNLENVLHSVLLSDMFYSAEIFAILNAPALSLATTTVSMTANNAYLAWSIPTELVGKVISVYETVAGVKTRISAYTVVNDINNKHAYNYVDALASSPAPQVTSRDLYIMTASHTVGNTVTVEITDFIPAPPPPPPPPPPTGATPPPTGTTGTTVI